MKLLLDVGNSRIRWALLGPDGLSHRGEVLHAGSPFVPLVEEAWLALPEPELVLVSNVAGPEFAEELTAWTLATWGETPEFVTPSAEGYGVVNAYRDPQQLGVDRWAALVAVHQTMPGGACVVDCGTAVTVDALSSDGRHLGGLILPGLTMMRHGLTRRAPGIRLTEAEASDKVLLARDTQDAVMGGTLYALVAAVERIVGDIAMELELPPRRIMTGGDAPAVLPLLSGQWGHEPDLVLKGLALMTENVAS